MAETVKRLSRLLRVSGTAALLGSLLPLLEPAVAAAEGDYLRDPLYGGLDRSQSARAAVSVQDALETKVSGEVLEWMDAGEMAGGSVTPLRTFRIESGHFCREYQEEVRLKGGENRERKRTACRINPGRWVPVDS